MAPRKSKPKASPPVDIAASPRLLNRRAAAGYLSVSTPTLDAWRAQGLVRTVRLAEVEVTLRLLAHDIAGRGLLTPSGGVRRVYDQLLAGVDRWDKLAQRIGVKRRVRDVTFDAAIAAEPEARCLSPCEGGSAPASREVRA